MLVEVRIADIDPPIPCIITPYSTKLVYSLLWTGDNVCPDISRNNTELKYSKYPNSSKYNGPTITDRRHEFTPSKLI
jgi:hypothetical protein